MRTRTAEAALLAVALTVPQALTADEAPRAKNVILMVADGAGFNTWKATAMHEGRLGHQVYDAQEWTRIAVSTYALRSEAAIPVSPEHGHVQLPHLVYDPARAWDSTPVEGGDDDYPFRFRGYEWLRATAPDSANTMSSIMTGRKTHTGSINVDGSGTPIDDNLANLAHRSGRKVGTVTSVTLSHATAAAGGGAHNPSRWETVAIAQEMLSTDVLDLIVGCGHPEYDNNGELIEDARDRVYDRVGGPEVWSLLRGDFDDADAAEWIAEQNESGIEIDAYRRWTLVDSRPAIEALVDGATPDRLLIVPRCGEARFWSGRAPSSFDAAEVTAADDATATADADADADDPEPWKTIKIGGTLQQQRGSRANPQNTPPGYDPRVKSVPDLPTLARVALNAVDDAPAGFFLHIEAGAIDWAMHDNQFGRMVEEMSEFNRTVETVVRWIETHGGWDQTLLVLTADHDHLLWGPKSNRLPFDPVVEGPEGTVQYRWLADHHSNALVPLYARGAGAAALAGSVDGTDPFYGPYIDQTDIYRAVRAAMGE